MEKTNSIPGMTPTAQATMVGFFNGLVGEAHPNDLQKAGYGEEAHPYHGDRDYTRGWVFGQTFSKNAAKEQERLDQINNR